MKSNLKLGDEWPYHYRGAKYHFNQEGDIWWSAPLKLIKVKCISGHKKIVKDLLNFKKQGGSFRITEDRNVITKLVEEDEGHEEYEAYYISQLEDDMVFEYVDINPNDIRHGDLWPGFYDGATYHFNIEGKIWWRDSYGRRWFTKKSYPRLLEKLTKWKRKGGSFKINEYGRVITLLEKIPYPDYIAEQVDSLNDIQKNIVEYKVESVNLIPIYICDFHEKIELIEPYNMDRKWSEEETEKLIDELRSLGRY